MVLGSANAAKTGSALIPPLAFSTLALPFDPLWALFILAGLILGWMARIGRMVSHNNTWKDIRRDLLVSLLIGGGNGLLAIVIISTFTLSYLQGVGIAFICAFAGVRTLETAVKWLFRKFMEDAGGKYYRRRDAASPQYEEDEGY